MGLIPAVGAWVAVAFYGLYVIGGLYGPQDYASAALDIGQNNVLLTQDTSLRLLLGAVSIVQLLFTMSILKGGSWSFPASLVISAVVLAIYADFVALYFSAPVRMGLRTSQLFDDLYVGIGFFALVWGYFTRPRVRRYLTRWL